MLRFSMIEVMLMKTSALFIVASQNDTACKTNRFKEEEDDDDDFNHRSNRIETFDSIAKIRSLVQKVFDTPPKSGAEVYLADSPEHRRPGVHF